MSHASQTPALPGSGWSQPLHEAIVSHATTLAAQAAPDQAPLAVFDCDNTCIRGDIGDVLWEHLVFERALEFSHPELEALIALVDEDPREALAMATSAPQAAYLARWLPLYPIASEKLGYARGLTWVTQIMVGLEESFVQEQCRQAITSALEAPMRPEEQDVHALHTSPPGVRICQEVREVIAYLQGLGFCCAIVSASCRWPVQAMAPYLAIDPDDVLAIDMEVNEAGKLGTTILPPITYRQGKLDAILARFGRAPQIVFGDAITDFEMLRQATNLGVLIDRGRQDIRDAIAPHSHILAQPRESLHFVSY